jgi:hypothetical protein
MAKPGLYETDGDRLQWSTVEQNSSRVGILSVAKELSETARTKLTPQGLLSFTMYRVSPFLFEGGETSARMVAKAVQHTQPLLRVLKTGVLTIEVGLGESLDAREHLCE